MSLIYTQLQKTCGIREINAYLRAIPTRTSPFLNTLGAIRSIIYLLLDMVWEAYVESIFCIIILTYSLVPGVSFDLGDSLYEPDAPKTTVSARI